MMEIARVHRLGAMQAGFLDKLPKLPGYLRHIGLLVFKVDFGLVHSSSNRFVTEPSDTVTPAP